MGDFALVDWIALAAAVASMLLTQRAKIIMAKNLSASAQQPLTYLNMIFGSFADILLFSVVFNSTQIIGIVISLLGPLIQLTYILITRNKSDLRK